MLINSNFGAVAGQLLANYSKMASGQFQQPLAVFYFFLFFVLNIIFFCIFAA